MVRVLGHDYYIGQHAGQYAPYPSLSPSPSPSPSQKAKPSQKPKPKAIPLRKPKRICAVCTHRHHQTEVCSECGHRGGRMKNASARCKPFVSVSNSSSNSSSKKFGTRRSNVRVISRHRQHRSENFLRAVERLRRCEQFKDCTVIIVAHPNLESHVKR